MVYHRSRQAKGNYQERLRLAHSYREYQAEKDYLGYFEVYLLKGDKDFKKLADRVEKRLRKFYYKDDAYVQNLQSKVLRKVLTLKKKP